VFNLRGAQQAPLFLKKMELKELAAASRFFLNFLPSFFQFESGLKKVKPIKNPKVYSNRKE